LVPQVGTWATGDAGTFGVVDDGPADVVYDRDAWQARQGKVVSAAGIVVGHPWDVFEE
jgi:hypothetical protein